MTSPKKIYPKEWPSHLTHEELLGTCREYLPAGYHLLPFEKFNSKQFEQFCWWLLKKDHQLVGCQIVGGNGTSQGGIDLFAFNRLESDRLIVFECKCWSDLSSRELDASIARFLKGPWVSEASRFVLLIAQPELGKLSKKWQEAKIQLNKVGVSAELWTGTKLTCEVQKYPDIVSKFFPGAAVSEFCNQWMQRVDFYEQLHKAFADQRHEVAKLAKDFVNTIGINDELETRTHHDNYWSLNRSWVYLNAILPSKKSYPGSAAVVLKKQNLEGMTVVLSQTWLFDKFLGSVNAPLSQNYRPFITGPLPDAKPEKFVLDLENCRFTLPEEETAELAYVADELTKSFLDALNELEKEWGAQHFPFIGTESAKVGICKVSKGLWSLILAFAAEHDYEKGKSEWHMFDASHSVLKPYTNQSNALYERGYHSILYAKDDVGGISTDDVLILWTPPDISSEEIGEREWWPCNFVLHWFKEQLLPAVYEWALAAYRKRSIFKWVQAKKFRQWWQEYAMVEDVRVLPLVENDRYREIGLKSTLETLQIFYYGNGDNQKIYFTSDNMKEIYVGLISLLEGGRGHASYIASNLQVGKACETHSEIIEQIQARQLTGKINCSSSVIDYSLRALLEACGQDDSWLKDPEKEQMFRALLPLMTFYDQHMMMRRHSNYAV